MRSLSFLISLLIIFSCSTGEKTYTVETVDGVRFVHNSSAKWGSDQKIRLKFIRQVGDINSGDETMSFFKPRLLGRDGRGNFYLMDSGNFRVVKFNSNWEYVREFGGEGQGPGEFSRFTFGMDTDKDGNVYILESGVRLQVLTGKGDFKYSFPMERFGNRFWYFRVLRSGKIAAVMRYLSRIRDDKEHFLLSLYSPEGEILKSFGKLLEPEGTMWVGSVNDAKLDVDNSDNIYVTLLNENVIQKYSSGGNLLMQIDRPLNFPIEHKMLDYEGRSFPEPTNVSWDIAIDIKGRIWVLTFNSQPENKSSGSGLIEDYNRLTFNIFDPEGVLLGYVPLPNYTNNIRIFGDSLYLIDTSTNMCVYEYRIIEK